MHETLKEYLTKLLPEMKQRILADAISVYANDEDKAQADLIGWVGEKPREVAPFDLPPIGSCAKTGKGILIEKKHEDPEKYQSIIIAPLASESFKLGVLVCASRQSEYFKQDAQLQAVRSLADHISRFWTGQNPSSTPN